MTAAPTNSDAHLTVGHGTLGNSQLSDEIIKPDGFILKRPGVWR